MPAGRGLPFCLVLLRFDAAITVFRCVLGFRRLNRIADATDQRDLFHKPLSAPLFPDTNPQATVRGRDVPETCGLLRAICHRPRGRHMKSADRSDEGRENQASAATLKGDRNRAKPKPAWFGGWRYPQHVPHACGLVRACRHAAGDRIVWL